MSKKEDLIFIPLSNDLEKIRFFGTLMPALLLLKQAPAQFFVHQVRRRLLPRRSVEAYIQQNADDFSQTDDVWLFVHRWKQPTFDPLTFARTHTFLAQLRRLLRRAGYRAEPLDPLSPTINLPQLAIQAGLGDASPYGLLVHPVFGPRVILSGMRTDYPMVLRPRWGSDGCTDCAACLKLCLQKPLETPNVNLGQCQTRALCFTVCPTGYRQGEAGAALAGRSRTGLKRRQLCPKSLKPISTCCKMKPAPSLRWRPSCRMVRRR